LDLRQVVSSTRLSDCGCRLVDREDDRFAVTGVEPDQLADDDVETGLLARFTHRGLLHALTALDEACRKAPLAGLAGAGSALAKQNAPVAGDQHRHRQLGIQIDDLATGGADGPCAALDGVFFSWRATRGAVLIHESVVPSRWRAMFRTIRASGSTGVLSVHLAYAENRPGIRHLADRYGDQRRFVSAHRLFDRRSELRRCVGLPASNAEGRGELQVVRIQQI
jgi:hypothetical protein